MFNYDVTHKCLIAEGWCPEADMEEIKRALREGTSVSRARVQSVLHRVQTKETPPTYFRNEPVAQGTQSIVDAYGMARYKEFNPAVFSVTTFPFLFGVMFGDVGHGFMMAMCGFLLVRYEEKLKYLANDEMFGTVIYLYTRTHTTHICAHVNTLAHTQKHSNTRTHAPHKRTLDTAL